MNDILNKPTVLVLNRNWQVINIRTPQEAFCQMAANVATGLEIEGENYIRPVTWGEWVALTIRPQDDAVQTVRGSIRERDGNRCQYTGRVLRPEEGSLDHVLPRSRGGKSAWENLVWAAKEVNARKGNRLPHEAGLKLLNAPRAPKELPVSAVIPGNKLESLNGERKGQHSIRINRQWRICFRWNNGSAQEVEIVDYH